MINPLRALMFLAGGVVVVGAGAYVSGALDPLLTPSKPAAVADVPATSGDATTAKPAETAEAKPQADAGKPAATDEAGGTTQPAASTETKPASDQAQGGQTTGQTDVAAVAPQETKPAEQATTQAGTEQKPAEQQPAATADKPGVPTFDLVRVEADGSVVIAGKAAANAKVEIVSNGKVIGTATASASGDFVVVLDDPLPPGDYQVTINATNPDNTVVASAQTAIISIPAAGAGQVLAMVEEPGKPSNIITAPAAEKPAETATATAGQDTAASGTTGQATTTAQGAATAQGSTTGTQETATTTAAATAQGTQDQAAQGTQTQPAQDTAAATTAAQDTATASQGGATTAGGAETASAEAKPAETEQKPAATETAPAADLVAVEAVEIEGSKIFVAGHAPAGSKVRVYANDDFLGETTTSPVGRFLVEAQHDLAVGSYLIRADVLSEDGTKVIARAAVPFEREPGENVSAVASADTATDKPETTAGAQDGSGQATQDQAAAAATTAPATEQPATGQTSAGDASKPAETGQASTAGASDGAASTAGAATAAGADTGQAATQTGTDQATQPAGAADATTGAQATTSDQQAASGATGQAAATEQPAAGETAQAPASDAAQKPAGTEAASAEQATAPALKPVKDSVIIRRGDNLWRISKRVYGRGVRYSTIYLANQSQIRDPDMIWPGQIFSVPDKTKQGETADMSKMGDQAVPSSAK